MALSQSVLSELLDAFRAGEGVDLLRDAVHLVLQELIEVEAAEVIGADRYQRTDTRVTERNGSRPRLLATQAGDVELRIPKLRKGSVDDHRKLLRDDHRNSPPVSGGVDHR
jgi:putative transposase